MQPKGINPYLPQDAQLATEWLTRVDAGIPWNMDELDFYARRLGPSWIEKEIHPRFLASAAALATFDWAGTLEYGELSGGFRLFNSAGLYTSDSLLPYASLVDHVDTLCKGDRPIDAVTSIRLCSGWCVVCTCYLYHSVSLYPTAPMHVPRVGLPMVSAGTAHKHERKIACVCNQCPTTCRDCNAKVFIEYPVEPRLLSVMRSFGLCPICAPRMLVNYKPPPHTPDMTEAVRSWLKQP